MKHHSYRGASGPQRTAPTRRSAQAGYSLLEVLVAILLVSVGLLGMAGLSAATFSYNKSAQIRLIGLALVNDYADRARVNIYGFDLNEYAIADDATAPTSAPTATADASEVDEKTAAKAVAADDKNQFMYMVSQRLPSGKAVVETTRSVKERSMDVYLMWKEPQAASGDTLLTAVQGNCPGGENDKGYSCIKFEVGL
jgi:type IV pilus assembly protein PilV